MSLQPAGASRSKLLRRILFLRVWLRRSLLQLINLYRLLLLTLLRRSSLLPVAQGRRLRRQRSLLRSSGAALRSHRPT